MRFKVARREQTIVFVGEWPTSQHEAHLHEHYILNICYCYTLLPNFILASGYARMKFENYTKDIPGIKVSFVLFQDVK